jgi:hypothetical protein
VNDWSFSNTFNTDLQILLLWIKMQEVSSDLSVEIWFNFHWCEFD